MSEAEIQNALYDLRQRQGQKLIVPNCGIFYGVSDLISISQKNLATDHEIKLTRSDFQNEFRSKSKIRKHQFLSWCFQSKQDQYAIYSPNYFFYAVPAFLIEPHEVQDYAGLLYYHQQTNSFEVVKRSRRIHQNTINKRQREFLERGLMFRYWKLRRKI